MTEFIQHRQRVEVTSFRLWFLWATDKNAGFSFECDENGVVNESDMNDAALENYRKCISGEFDVVNKGVKMDTHSYTEPAIIKCHCGCNVELYGFTNTCDCGADYNMSGQQLASREQWGEETGEQYSDLSTNMDCNDDW